MGKTYRAYVRFKDGSPDIVWHGLRKTQAQWRYHWLNRNVEKLYPRYCEFGWQSEEFYR